MAHDVMAFQRPGDWLRVSICWELRMVICLRFRPFPAALNQAGCPDNLDSGSF